MVFELWLQRTVTVQVEPDEEIEPTFRKLEDFVKSLEMEDPVKLLDKESAGASFKKRSKNVEKKIND